MRKLLFLVASMLSIASIATAQTFEKGTKVLSATASYSNIYDCPMSISYEVGICNLGDRSSIGINGYIGYAWSSEDIQYGADPDDTYGDFKYDDFFVAVGANYHYNTGVKNLDLYGGFRLGYDYRLTDLDWDDDDFDLIIGDKVEGTSMGFVYNVHVGARYYFWKGLAVHTELGYGISVASLGLSYKF